MDLRVDQDFPHPNPYLPALPRPGGALAFRVMLITLGIAAVSVACFVWSVDSGRPFIDSMNLKWLPVMFITFAFFGGIAGLVAAQLVLENRGWRQGKIVPAFIGQLKPGALDYLLKGVSVAIDPVAGITDLVAQQFINSSNESVVAIWRFNGRIGSAPLPLGIIASLVDKPGLGDFVWIVPPRNPVIGPSNKMVAFVSSDLRVRQCRTPPLEAQQWLIASVGHALKPSIRYPAWVQGWIANGPREQAMDALEAWPIDLAVSDFGKPPRAVGDEPLQPRKPLTDGAGPYDRKPPRP